MCVLELKLIRYWIATSAWHAKCMLAWVWVVTERKEAKTFAFAITLQSLQFPYLSAISLNCSMNTPENMKMSTNNAMNVPESVCKWRWKISLSRERTMTVSMMMAIYHIVTTQNECWKLWVSKSSTDKTDRAEERWSTDLDDTVWKCLGSMKNTSTIVTWEVPDIPKNFNNKISVIEKEKEDRKESTERNHTGEDQTTESYTRFLQHE